MKIYLPAYESVITIDDCDLPLFSAHRWYVSRKGTNRYVGRNERGRTIFLHRAIMSPPSDMVVDHIDGNGLNNSRDNLRVVTQQQNLWNRPRNEGDIGVSFRASRKKWRATIDHCGSKIDLGAFESEAMARAARDVASRILRGDIGTQNDASADYSSFNLVHFSPAARRLLIGSISG